MTSLHNIKYRMFRESRLVYILSHKNIYRPIQLILVSNCEIFERFSNESRRDEGGTVWESRMGGEGEVVRKSCYQFCSSKYIGGTLSISALADSRSCVCVSVCMCVYMWVKQKCGVKQ